MKTLQDCFGQKVRFTDERLAHILEHAEMKGLGAEIERDLRVLFVFDEGDFILVTAGNHDAVARFIRDNS